MTNAVVLGTISLNKMAGGLEKNIVLLANHLVQKGIDVNLISFDFPDADAFYEIDPRVKWYKVGNSRPHAPISFWKRLALIRQMRIILHKLQSPIIICFHHGILFRFLLASFLLPRRIVCSERNSLSLYEYIRQSKWTLNFFMLSFVDKITVQFPSYVNEYPFWLRNRIRVISNPVFPTRNYAKPYISNDNARFVLLSVGRLCTQKNQAELIEAFASVCDKHLSWDLYIVGDGVWHNALQNVIDKYSLQERIFLVGKSNDVPSWYIRSHLFCMPSQWEGFPNALAEAMAHGLPCVGFSSCAGVRDLIEDGVTGLLPAPGLLSKSLDTLMGSEKLRKDMGMAAVVAMEQYLPSSSFDSWDKVLCEISK